LKTEDEVGPALEWLTIALYEGRFDQYRREEALALRTALLLRLRRYTEALSSLSADAARSRLSLDPEYPRLRALAFLGLGKRAEAVAELGAAARRFPSDPRFARLFFERFGTANPAPAERALADLFLKSLDALTMGDPQLALLALPFMTDGDLRLRELQAYRAQGLVSARASLLALEYGLIGDEDAIAEMISPGVLLHAEDLYALESLLGSAKGRASLDQSLKSLDASLQSDRDGDGFYEEVTVYKAGRPAAWRLDADQDGRPEISLVFAEGLPESATYSDTGSSFGARWSAYPYLASLDYGHEGYRFGPLGLAYAPLGLSPFPSTADPAIFIPFPSSLPPPLTRTAAANALELDRSEGSLLDVITLDRGQPLRRERFDGGRITAILEYKDGRPESERVDTDVDGWFETERFFGTEAESLAPSIEAGTMGELAPASMRIDQDRDGLPEYSEAFAFPYQKEWDLDRNGSWDLRQSRLASGGLLIEISSRLDGRFDEAIEVDSAGRILSVQREGRRLALYPDANPSLRWIGDKAFDLGSDLPPVEGIYVHGQSRYRLVYAGKEGFAELLP
jgi:hypothetical protein